MNYPFVIVDDRDRHHLVTGIDHNGDLHAVELDAATAAAIAERPHGQPVPVSSEWLESRTLARDPVRMAAWRRHLLGLTEEAPAQP